MAGVKKPVNFSGDGFKRFNGGTRLFLPNQNAKARYSVVILSP